MDPPFVCKSIGKMGKAILFEKKTKGKNIRREDRSLYFELKRVWFSSN